jgi:hypothetical protein
MEKPDNETVLSGLLQLRAGLMSRNVTSGRVCLQQLSPLLNSDYAILGQLPLPPANAVHATKSPVKLEVQPTGGRNGIGN